MTNKTIGFYFLFATQFLLIVGKIFIDVKVGLFSLVFTILFLAIIFIQLNNRVELRKQRDVVSVFCLGNLLFI